MSGVLLTTDLLEAAYRQGVFPMADEWGRISWYSPDPRAVLELDGFHVPQTLAATIRKGLYEVRVDTAFEDVMRGCAERPETWISDDILQVYVAMHRAGKAHSVEAWRDGKLAGGLYGVALGGAFFGESMFSRARDASKVCLAATTTRLRERGFTLHDCQFATPHLARFGLKLLPRRVYLRRLALALAQDCRFD